MDWIGEFTPEQWAIIGVVAAVATALATLLSAGLAMIWRVADRKQVAWVTHQAWSGWSAEDSHGIKTPPMAEADLSNVGDASALAVKIVGLGCTVQMQGERIDVYRREHYELVPALRSGESVHLSVYCEAEDWGDADVAIVWTIRPAWTRRRRVELLPLAQVAPRPRYSHSLPSVGEQAMQALQMPTPEPPPPVLPRDLQAERAAVPTRAWSPTRRKVLRELRNL